MHPDSLPKADSSVHEPVFLPHGRENTPRQSKRRLRPKPPEAKPLPAIKPPEEPQTQKKDMVGLLAPSFRFTTLKPVGGNDWQAEIAPVKTANIAGPTENTNAPANGNMHYRFLVFFARGNVPLRIFLRCGCHAGPMAYFLGHSTALRYLRSCDSIQVESYSRAVPQPGKVVSAQKLFDNPYVTKNSQLKEALSHIPIELLASDARSRSKSALVQPRIWHFPQHAQCFIKVRHGIYVATPEACFIQLSRDCSLIELIKLGFEFCGTYSLDPSIPVGFRTRRALTTRLEIEHLIEKWPGQTNQKALRALRYVRDNSASPMESCLALMLGLPPKLGGYGLGMPTMNAEISISGKQSKRVTHRNYHCDLYWPKYHFAVEYNSREFHTSERAIERDTSRINDLKAAGINAIAVTRAHVASPQTFDAIARSVANLMGKRIRSNRIDAINRQQELRKQLFSKDRWASKT